MIYLFGAGGHAKVIIEILQAQGVSGMEAIDAHKVGAVLNVPILHRSIPEKLEAGDGVIIAIGNNYVRNRISRERNDVDYAKAIHPSCNISPTAVIGAGSVAMAGVSVNADSVIGEHVILNTNCCVDHDCKIGDCAHISPNAALAGNVKIGEGTQIGIGACVIPGINIGKWATIGAGAVIIEDVPDYAVIAGNPGRIIRYNSMNE
ncbi:MAG TPA: acetyltransferase [Mucilaginibacter sp.]|jgi:acetyltransferase EpsM|nr:acetyltransferase [Mucilaginibacter sp.]